MTRTSRRNGLALAALGPVLVALAAACNGGGTSTTSTSALASTIASATASTGTLLCSPAQAQVDSCSGLAAGDACTLSTADGGSTTSGTCRTTIDGATVACAPTPPSPPQELVDACSALAAGESCQVTEADGDAHQGVCVTARDGSTLVCGRIRTPPQVAIDACSALAEGDACSLPARTDAGAITGVCSLGPASTGPLACAPAQELRPKATSACSGLPAGATCTVGRGHDTVSGTCVTPAAGGDAVCVVPCGELGGLFRCGPGRRGGEHGGPAGSDS